MMETEIETTNEALQSGSFPDKWKEALVKPLLKQSGCDPVLEIIARQQSSICLKVD